MQVQTESVEYNFELLAHPTDRILEEFYRLNHQKHTQGICIVCHLPVDGTEQALKAIYIII